MIRVIHYFSAEVKPKLMSSQGAALNNWYRSTVPFSEMYKSIVKKVIKDIILLVISEG